MKTENEIRLFIFSKIREYLDNNKHEGELIWTRLMECRKHTKSNNIYGRKSYIQEAISLSISSQSTLYPDWQGQTSEINIKLCNFAFDLFNSISHRNLCVCSHVSVCEVPEKPEKASENSRTMCFEDRIQFKYDSDSNHQEYRELKNVAAWLHELGHWIEFHNPYVRAMCNAFLEYRTRDSKLERMKPPNERYYCKNGNFPWEYCGLIDGDWTDDRHTEILSTGLEMLFEDSIKFFANDHEYFTLIVNILKGNIIESNELKIDNSLDTGF